MSEAGLLELAVKESHSDEPRMVLSDWYEDAGDMVAASAWRDSPARLDTLPPHIARLLPAIREHFLATGLATGPCDRDAAWEAAGDAYAVAGLPRPRTQIWLPSPLQGAIGASMLTQVGAQVRDQVGDQVGDQVWAQVWAQVGAQVRDQVGAQVWAQVGDQVWAQVGAQVGDQVWAQVGDQVRDQVGDQVWAQVGAQVRDQVGAQVWAQVGDQVWAQVGAQVRAQVWAQVGAQVWDQVRDQVGDQVGDQVWAQVGAQVWDQVGDQVWDQVGDQVGDQVWNQVWDQVRAQVGDQVRAQVWNQVRDQVGDQVWDQVYRCGYGQHDAAWLSYYATFDLAGLTSCHRLRPLVRLAANCGWWWPFKGFVIFTERPETLVMSGGRLKMIRYSDGFEVKK